MIKKPLFIVFCLLCASMLSAQNQNSDPFRDIEKEMDKWMQQLRQQGWAFTFPSDQDTSFFFKWDTTFQGGNGNSFFFRFNPPSGQQLNDALGWDDMMKELREFSDQFNQDFFQPTPPASPSDDGALRNREGQEIPLPEEQLREQEKEGNFTPKSGEKATPTSKSKVKTIRI
jgi:hypothetical protein